MKKSAHNRRRRPGAADSQGRDAADAVVPIDVAGGGLADVQADGGLEADGLTDTTLQVLERIRPHLGAILAVAGAAAAACVAYAVVTAQREASRAQSWDGCIAALSRGDSDGFSDVVRRYPGTDAARWAELMIADSAAAEGADVLFSDRQRAEGRLRTAVDVYSSIMAARPRGLLAERAVFGLAKARESLGQLEEARRGYEAVAAEFAGDPIAKLAAGRAVDLGRPATRQWYDWFAAQKTTPPGAAVSSAPSSNGAASEAASPSAPDKPADAESRPAAPGQP